MRHKLNQLSENAMKLIKNPAIDDPATIARLAPIPAKLHQMLYQLQQIEDESLRIQDLLERLTPTTLRSGVNATGIVAIGQSPDVGRSRRMRIRIEINWPILEET